VSTDPFSADGAASATSAERTLLPFAHCGVALRALLNHSAATTTAPAEIAPQSTP